MLQVTRSPHLFGRLVLCPFPPMPNTVPSAAYHTGSWMNTWVLHPVSCHSGKFYSRILSPFFFYYHYTNTSQTTLTSSSLVFKLLSQVSISSRTLQHLISLIKGIILSPLSSNTINFPIAHWNQHLVFLPSDQVPPNVSSRFSLQLFHDCIQSWV